MKKKQDLVIVCKHIFSSCKKDKEIIVEEVLEDTFTCVKCSKNQPKTKKAFMDMFITLCRCCLKKVAKYRK